MQKTIGTRKKQKSQHFYNFFKNETAVPIVMNRLTMLAPPFYIRLAALMTTGANFQKFRRRQLCRGCNGKQNGLRPILSEDGRGRGNREHIFDKLILFSISLKWTHPVGISLEGTAGGVHMTNRERFRRARTGGDQAWLLTQHCWHVHMPDREQVWRARTV